ncbi:MAG: DMT family transporter [Saprospiraceae bacterium]|nr:DMT family transporter [Saprospiraceae bacterium]
MSPKTKILLTILMWTFGGVTLKLISSSNLFTIMALGLFASSLANYLYLFNTGGFDRKVLSVKFVFFSMTGYFFYWLFFLHSIEAYGSNVSAPLVLNYTWPFFTGIFTILFYKREKFNSIFYLSSILGFCGVVILLLKGDFASFSIIDSVKGFAFGLLAGLSYGLFSAYSSSLTTDKEHSHYLL